ncbi:MAG: hypothetical protein QXV69_05965 [Sulfolobaceae archaeon]
MLTEKLLSDSKFYNKPISIFFTSRNCSICDKLYNEITSKYISSKYYWLRIDSEEYLHYFIRLTRGVIPSVVVMNGDLRILGIIESNNSDFIENALKNIYENLENKKLIASNVPHFVPEPQEFDPFIVHEVVLRIINGEVVDHRALEVIEFYKRNYTEFSNIQKFITNYDVITKSILYKEKIEINNSYTAGVLVENGIEDPKVLLEYINEDGSVYRSKRKEVSGLLIDESIAGNALLKAYELYGEKEYLEYAKKIYEYIIKNNVHEKGFLDVPKRDPLSNIEFLEPLANAEAGIFFSRYYLLTKDEKAREYSEKAIRCAYGGSKNTRVLTRVIIAYLKLKHSILTKNMKITDPRIEYLENPCKDEEFYYNNNCYKSIDEITIELL